MIRIVILGAGTVATHFCKAFLASDTCEVIQVYSRKKISLKSVPAYLNTTTSLSKIKEADLYIIAIPDDAIIVFSETLPFKNKLVAHTSGSVAMKKLSSNNRKAVFYPLQTFSKDREVNFSQIPICIEAESSSDLTLLKKLGKAISEKVSVINSSEREKLHLAAVFVNNFVNHMYTIGSEILSEENISFDLLKPLIAETAKKIETLSPKKAQTGPAKRNDIKTIEKQMRLLKSSTNNDLYNKLTKAIFETHGKKL